MAVDTEGSVVVCGCLTDDETLYVTKFTVQGQQLWREQLGYDDVQPLSSTTDGDRGGASACAAALTTDAADNIYVTGNSKISPDSADTNVFVVRLTPMGSLVWKQAIATPHPDWATSIHVDAATSSVFVGGASQGNVTMGPLSLPNCDGGCEDGFVARLRSLDGSPEWIHSVVSRGVRAARVFDLTVDPATQALVVVGETHGDLVSSQDVTRSRSTDVFVRRLDTATGVIEWTTQLDSSLADFCQLPASASSPSSYTRLYPRGRCAVAVHVPSLEVSVVGSTLGLLSTFPSQSQQYRDLCGNQAPSPCMQLFVARLAIETGSVRWIRQLVHRTPTSAERGLAFGEGGLAVLGTANADFFGSAERMEQLLVLNIASDGVVQWTAEVGLDGEDHAVDIAGAKGLVVLGHGSNDQSRRGTTSSESYIRRLRANDGAIVPMCVDSIGFDESLVANVTRDANLDFVTEIPVRRGRMCVGTEATVRFRYEVASDAGPTSSAGFVHFKTTQEAARIAMSVPSSSTVLQMFLEASSEDATIDAADSQRTIDLVVKQPVAPTNATADGRLWQELTWILFVASLVATGLVVVLGRLCWRSSRWSWRRAKIFQYKTLRLRGSHAMDHSSLSARPGSGLVAVTRSPMLANSNDSMPPAKANYHDDETEELRTHLKEIQHLNDSLDGLLSLHSANSPLPSPRSSLARQPTSPKRLKTRRQWKWW